VHFTGRACKSQSENRTVIIYDGERKYRIYIVVLGAVASLDMIAAEKITKKNKCELPEI